MDDLAATNQKPASMAPPPASRRPVQRKDDFDDAPTEFLPSKQIGALVAQARGPASVPPPPASRRPPASVPPPPVSSQRPGKFVTGADEDEDGRTFVRGAPRIVKRSVPPSASSSAQVQAMSPAAVIKATLESARSRRGGDGLLMPPPPADLLEDRADLHPADQGQQSTMAMGNAPASVRPQLGPYTAPMGMQPVGVSELGATMLAGVQPMTGPPPPSSMRGGHMTGPPPPMSQPPQSFRPQQLPQSIPPAPQSYNSNYPPAYGGAQSSAVPAHFQVAQSPYSDGRLDPPGTSVTSRHRAQGRPASAWAMALVAAGLFVGVGAVAVLQGNDSVMDTTASFVDPSRASKPVGNGAEAQPQPQPQPQAVAPTVVVPAATDPNAAPPPVAAPPVATAAATGGIIGASSPPPAATTPPAPAPVAIKEPPPPRATPAPPPRPASPPAAAPAPRPPPVVASKPAPAATGDETAEAKPKPTKGAKKGAAGESDEETKKALEALQKAQLESSFGDK